MSQGDSFGAYRVVRKVGQGGMGAVFLGEHSLIGRRAAIKVLRNDRTSQRENIERFFTEARAAAAIEDPGIVQIYDFGITPAGVAYLVMEFLDGESLSGRIRRLRLLPQHSAIRITRQIAGSLAAAHALGIVHRDLKPENLFIVRDAEAAGGERPKILDFGIAKLGAGEVRSRFQTSTGTVMGTPAYMSPEQCNDTGKIDHRTDIYSLGCVLFHLLTGRPPFEADGAGAMIAAHLREPPPVPSQVAAHVHPVVDPIVARCLAKRPEDRFSSMLELQQACDAILGELPEVPTIADPHLAFEVRDDAVTTLGTSAGESIPDNHPRRMKMWLAVSAVAVTAGIVLAVMTAGGGGDSSSAETVTPAAQPAPPPAPRFDPGPVPAAKAPAQAPTITPQATPVTEPVQVAPPAVDTTQDDPAPTTRTTPGRKKPVPKKSKPPVRKLYDDRI